MLIYTAALTFTTSLITAQECGATPLHSFGVATAFTIINTGTAAVQAFVKHRIQSPRRRDLGLLMMHICPACKRNNVELTSEGNVHCVDCEATYVLNTRDGLPRRKKA